MFRRRRIFLPGVYHNLIGAGIDDWGGVSPVTIDHVNPEAPWPELDALARHTAEMDKILVASPADLSGVVGRCGSLARQESRASSAAAVGLRRLGA